MFRKSVSLTHSLTYYTESRIQLAARSNTIATAAGDSAECAIFTTGVAARAHAQRFTPVTAWSRCARAHVEGVPKSAGECADLRRAQRGNRRRLHFVSSAHFSGKLCPGGTQATGEICALNRQDAGFVCQPARPTNRGPPLAGHRAGGAKEAAAAAAAVSTVVLIVARAAWAARELGATIQARGRPGRRAGG